MKTFTCHQCGSVWVKSSMKRIPKHYRQTATCGMVVCGASGTLLPAGARRDKPASVVRTQTAHMKGRAQ